MESVLEQDGTARRKPDENGHKEKDEKQTEGTNGAAQEYPSHDTGAQQVEDNLYKVEYDALDFSISDTSD